MAVREIVVETKSRNSRRTLTLPAKRPAPATVSAPVFAEPTPSTRKPAAVEKPTSILSHSADLARPAPVPRKQKPPRDLKRPPIEGAPVAAKLAPEHRPENPIGKPITQETREFVAKIVVDIEGGDQRTLGLRTLIAATAHAPGYRIGMVAVALQVAGHIREANRLRETVFQMKAARFEEAAKTSLALAEAKHAERDAERAALAAQAPADGEASANG